MDCRLSVIVPNRNGEKTIGLCLKALLTSKHDDSFEVIVVDDASTDSSVSIIEQFPCRLIKQKQQVGAAVARNIGALHSRGTWLFFTDADCLVQEDTLIRAERFAEQKGADTIIGGTYTRSPYDQSFYSYFQSIFIHHCELKSILRPDYIAAHAMVIAARTFYEAGGFPSDFLPIIEDVEFSHRLRKKGYRLIMMPELEVQHFFGYRSMADSAKNGYVKSKYWTLYSLDNSDLLTDSGTASLALKINVLTLFFSLSLGALYLIYPSIILPLSVAMLIVLNLLLNLKLFYLFGRTRGTMFMIAASGYYMLMYPFAVGAGSLVGLMNFMAVTGGRTGTKI